MKAFRTSILPVLFLLPLLSFGQSEIGIRFGVANYMGDLSPGRLILSESKPAVGLIFRQNLTAKWKFRVSATHGRVSGSDLNFIENEERNLSFRSTITELSVDMEYNLLPFSPGARNFTFAPYIFAGVSGFRFTPQAELDGTYLNLQPLGTEGQNIPGSNIKPYSTYSFAVPFGIGFKKTVSDVIVFGMEAGLRATVTDYIDDVSRTYPDFDALAQTDNGEVAVRLSDRRSEFGLEQAEPGTRRGNPNTKDMYGFFLITITKRLGYANCYTF